MTARIAACYDPDVVERARQAVDAWDRFAVWAPTRVPGVRACLDLVRDLLAEVERLRGSRDDALAELVGLDGLLSERDARIAVLRTDLARMTERAEVAWQDAETERDACTATPTTQTALPNLKKEAHHD